MVVRRKEYNFREWVSHKYSALNPLEIETILSLRHSKRFS
jgi:hypothetical protein